MPEQTAQRELLIKMQAMCTRITTKFGTLISPCERKGQMISWEDWIFFESRRR